MAIDVLKGKGVPEERIFFLNLIASPEGIQNFAERAPKVRVVTAFIDQGLNEKKYVPATLTVSEARLTLHQLHCTRLGGFRR